MSSLRISGLVGLFGLFVAASPLVSQSDSTRIIVSGTVVDALGQPIEAAEVRFIGTDLTAMTSPTGTFRLEVLPGRRLLLQVRRPGFNPQLLEVSGAWMGKILLTAGSVQLPDISVTARYAKPMKYAATNKYDDVFQRRRLGLGELIDREQVDQRAAQGTAQLLEGHAGIRVQIRRAEGAGDFGGTFIAFSRCNEFPPKINVYVDGHKLQPRLSTGSSQEGESVLSFMARGHDQGELDRRREIRMMVGEMLERINPSDIEMIEIFRGPSELPAQFNDGNCAAIAVWTRQGR